MPASYAVTGTTPTTLTDDEARRFAERAIATGAKADPLARWVLAAVERLESDGDRAVLAAARLWRHAICDKGPDCGDGYTYHSHDCPTNETMRGLVEAIDQLEAQEGQR